MVDVYQQCRSTLWWHHVQIRFNSGHISPSKMNYLFKIDWFIQTCALIKRYSEKSHFPKRLARIFDLEVIGLLNGSVSHLNLYRNKFPNIINRIDFIHCDIFKKIPWLFFSYDKSESYLILL